MTRIYLSTPHLCGNEIFFINDAINKNWVTSIGENLNNFEQKLASYLQKSSKVTVLSSGTAAIHLALILLGVKQNDEVICQSMTFSASANPIKYIGAKPVFIDSEPETWNICPNVLEDCIKNRLKNGIKPKAIIAVHLYGMPYVIDAIHSIADKYEIPIIEDSAEALGGSYKNQKSGTFGTISILSFNGNKIITTSGGGALVSKDEKINEKALFLATQARDSAPHYQHSEIGYNYRMSNICAGIGRGQMQVLDKHVDLRRENHFFYKEYFKKYDFIKMLEEPNSDYFSNHWLSCILINENENNKNHEDLRLAFEKQNIETRPLWKPMHLQPVFKNELYFGGNISENLFKIGLCLPSGSNLTSQEKQRIIDVLEEYLF